MKKLSTITLTLALSIFLASFAWAVPGTSLQSVLDNITTAPVAGDSSIDVTTDYLSDTIDSYWSITGSGGSVATIIIELAGFANGNTFGVYDMTDSTKKVELFAGAAGAGSQALLSIKADGSVYVNFGDTGVDFARNSFGYYLLSEVGNYFYSDTSLNADQFDHMYAYQGIDVDTVQLPGLAPGVWTDNEFVLAYEDLYGGGDQDFTDFVVMVESVTPIPEPGTLILLGTALVGCALVGRKKMFIKA